MALSAGDIVRLLEDRQFEGQLFQSGTLGTVAATLPSMAACLVVLGHDTTTRILPESALALVQAKPPKKSAKAPGLRFAQQDRVKLREARTYGTVVYPEGAPGTVAEVLVSLGSYLIDFDMDSTDRVVPDSALDPE